MPPHCSYDFMTVLYCVQRLPLRRPIPTFTILRPTHPCLFLRPAASSPHSLISSTAFITSGTISMYQARPFLLRPYRSSQLLRRPNISSSLCSLTLCAMLQSPSSCSPLHHFKKLSSTTSPPSKGPHQQGGDAIRPDTLLAPHLYS